MKFNLIKTITELENIKRIAGFQISRLKDKKAVNKDLVLMQALTFIRIHLSNIDGHF